MVYKQALPLLAVTLLRFTDALPLDGPGQQHAAECEDEGPLCGGGLETHCDERLLRCGIPGGFIAQYMGFCVQCSGTGDWYPRRMWTNEEYLEYMFYSRIPSEP